jgi:hypothetical protein
MTATERQYKAESDLRTLTDADDIRRDDARLKEATKHATKQMSRYRRITGRKR